MSLFDIFKKKKVELTAEQLKRNKMWKLWAEEKMRLRMRSCGSL